MLDNLKKELERFRDRVIIEARKNLTRKKKNASKSLYNSLKGSVKVSKNSFSMSFDMEQYGLFQDKGVKGTKSNYIENRNTPYSFGTGSSGKTFDQFKQSIHKWIKQKGIKGRDKKGRFITDKSLTYLIARSIYRKGIKGSMFFTRPFELEYKKLSNDIIETYGLDLDEFINFTLKDLNNGR